MFRLLSLVLLSVALAACAPAVDVAEPAPVEAEPVPEFSEAVVPIEQSQELNGVTVTADALSFMPHDADMLAELDSGYAHLLDDAPAVARLDISAANASGAPVDLYPATFGSIIIDGEQIDLASFQFFADGDTLDNTLQDGASATAGVWFPLTASQFEALRNGTNVRIIITDGIEPIYTFDIQN